MAASGNGRLLKELKEVAKDDTSGITAGPVTEGNLRHLKGTIPGPSGTPYEGGVFEIDIVIPKQYPFEPPKMKYMTKIWHPNISSQTGAICLVCRLLVLYLVPIYAPVVYRQSVLPENDVLTIYLSFVIPFPLHTHRTFSKTSGAPP
jgi:ubiquitin-protein ligase